MDASETVIEFLRRYVGVLKTQEFEKRHDFTSRMICIAMDRLICLFLDHEEILLDNYQIYAKNLLMSFDCINMMHCASRQSCLLVRKNAW